MEISVKQEEGCARFDIIGDIDEHGAELLESSFKKLDMGEVRKVIFDFKTVSHIGSAGIGMLLLFYKDLAISGREIRVENVSREIYELFEMVSLDSIFTITRR